MSVVLQLLVLLFASLATGGLLVNWIGLGRAMARLSTSTYIEFHQATNRTFDPYMPIVVLGAILGGVVLALLSPGIRSPSGVLALFGLCCYAAGLFVSVTRCVPINKKVEHWSINSPPDNLTVVRERWLRFHVARTLLSVPGLASYILSCLLSR
jgi:anthrone oxygenase-like protein